MARSSLFGRRVHITGSIDATASAEEVGRARQVVVELIKDLLRKGAGFVVPVDAGVHNVHAAFEPHQNIFDSVRKAGDGLANGGKSLEISMDSPSNARITSPG